LAALDIQGEKMGKPIVHQVTVGVVIVLLALGSLADQENSVGQTQSNEGPIAFPITFNGPGPYMKVFSGTGYGVVFEDDGETGYLYVTNEKQDEILDALHLYNYGGPAQIEPGDQVFVVWNEELQKVGVFYHDAFQAIVDFRNHVACCRTGFPEASSEWVKSSHEWQEKLVAGLEPCPDKPDQ
jgi:hypothetical protein